jgi:sterol desaturase/sphingolipid hydroxylase (fatty acid hydroxylase superfamily)
VVIDPSIVLLKMFDGVVAALVDPSNRTYLLYLVSAALAAGLILVRQLGLKTAYKQLASLGSGYFISRSSLTDVALMSFNSLFRALLVLPYLGTSLGVAIVVGSWLQGSVGDAYFIQQLSLPLASIALLFSAVLFLVDDGSRFLTHLAMHRIPVLWSLHKVHHSATVLTPLTIYRVHPLESVIYFCRGTLSAGIVIGVFVWLFGRVLSGWEILGVNAFGFLFNIAFANLRHSHIYLSFGRAERWFISPAQHQLHHSAHHHHANLGSALAIWDRLLGSWKPAKVCRTKLTFGIEQ